MVRKVDKIQTAAHLTDEITELEKRNSLCSRNAAKEAIVLLENNGILPLNKKCKIAMYGDGVTNTVKCGSGSGEVNNRKSISIYEGMKNAGAKITSDKMLLDYREKSVQCQKDYIEKKQKEAGLANFKVSMAVLAEPYRNPDFPVLKEEDLDKESNTCIYVISRISGESYDRELKKGDYYLSEHEEKNIRLCRENYEKFILVINAGGIVDFSAIADLKIDAILFISMLGQEGGNAFADVIFGECSPSGHLTDTWPVKYEDIPYANEYSYLNGNEEYDEYKEDIYVGYRYFDTFKKEPKYCFGYGLSYTEFSFAAEVELERDQVIIHANVKNTGDFSGKEVVQIYASCPNGKLKKEYQRLVAFKKTSVLEPGQSEDITITFPLSELASYDEEISARLLEKGNYLLRVGNSSRNTKVIGKLILENTAIVSKHEAICKQHKQFEKLIPTAIDTGVSEEELQAKTIIVDTSVIKTLEHTYAEPEEYHDSMVDKLMQKLTVQEMAELVVGCGNDLIIPMEHTYTVPGVAGYSTYKFHNRGISDLSFCDGPAGIRVQQQAVAIKGKNKIKAITPALEMLYYMPKVIRFLGMGKPSDGTPLYQYTTAFPVGTALAQTWNVELLEDVGRAVNEELEEYGIDFWLAPGLNIHRNPLCGRNYEYYSEDPLLSGKVAAAITRGAQCQGSHSVTLKHFFCNNQETNRGNTSAEVSERAIREIYLKGFEIGVKEGHAKGVMTSYNRVNGIYSAVNYDGLIKVLRNEWGFDGLVMTDWDFTKPDCDADVSMVAGVDILMQGEKKQTKAIQKALKEGRLDEKYVRRSASHILRAICEKEVAYGNKIQ